MDTEPEQTANTKATPPNPFVGPRAFTNGERLFGRDRESGELLDILIAQRIVLLYSPSGAGKSSLVEAAIKPALVDAGFNVLPTIRLNLPPEATAAGQNPFLLSAAHSLGLIGSNSVTTDSFANTTLSDMLGSLATANEDGPVPEVVIVDQLEEVLTAGAYSAAIRTDQAVWFSQLGAALQNRSRWALFCIREDHLAGLDPFRDAIPNRLRARYRLELLESAAANDAIRGPAADAGVDFETEPDALAQLISNLSNISVFRDGVWQTEPGRLVEPVQLQVVCRELWDRLNWQDLPSENNRFKITAGEIGGQVLAVDQALRAYIDRTLAQIALPDATNDIAEPLAMNGPGAIATERTIREWIESNLISAQGTRRPVQLGSAESLAIGTVTIEELQDAHLVRGDARQSGVWFELAHDRLVAPMLASNAAWFEQNLHPFQMQARLWNAQGRDERLLFESEALADAETWIRANPDQLAPYEAAFLAECRDHEQARERTERNRRRLLAVGALAIAVLAITSLFAIRSWLAANEVANASSAQHLALESDSAYASGDHETAALLARQGYLFDKHADESTSSDVLMALNSAVGTFPFSHPVGEHVDWVFAVSVSSDETFAASGSRDGTVKIWSMTEPVNGEIRAQFRAGLSVRALAISADNAQVVAAGCDVETANRECAISGIHVFTLSAPDQPPVSITGASRETRTLAISPLQPDIVVTGGLASELVIWSLSAESVVGRIETGAEAGIAAIAFSSDGNWMAVAGCMTLDKKTDACSKDEGSILLYDARRLLQAQSPIILTGAPGLGVRAIAFAPDSNRLIAAGGDRTFVLWDLGPTEVRVTAWSGFARTLPPVPGIEFGQFDTAPAAVDFSPDGELIGGVSSDQTLRLWTARGSPVPLTKAVGSYGLLSLAFTPDGTHALTGGSDGTVLSWDLQDTRTKAPGTLFWSGNSIWDLEFTTNNELISAGGTGNYENGATWYMGIADRLAAPVQLTNGEAVWSVSMNSNGTCLAVGTEQGTIQLWARQSVDLPFDSGQTITFESITRSPVRAVDFSPDGSFLVSGQWDGSVLRWSIDCSRLSDEGYAPTFESLLQDLEPAEFGNVRSLALNPDGSLLAVGGCLDRALTPLVCKHGGFLYIWDFALGRSTKVCCSSDEPLNVPYSVVFSPDGSMLAMGTVKGDIQIVCDIPEHAANGQDLSEPDAVWSAHSFSIRSLAFMPDGSTLFSGSEDSRVLSWDLTAWSCGSGDQAPLPRELVRFPAGVLVRALAIDASGANLAIGLSNGDVRLITFDADRLATTVCNLVSRNLTDAEWDRYVGVDPGLSGRLGMRPESTQTCQGIESAGEPTDQATPP